MSNSATTPEKDSFLKESLLYRYFKAQKKAVLEFMKNESEKTHQDIGFDQALMEWLIRCRPDWDAEWKIRHNISREDHQIERSSSFESLQSGQPDLAIMRSVQESRGPALIERQGRYSGNTHLFSDQRNRRQHPTMSSKVATKKFPQEFTAV